jgi:ATP/ADP translocase
MAERNARVDRVLEAGFRLHPGELWPTLLMFLASLCTVGAFIVGRSVRDSLFLSHVSADALPWMYTWASVAVALSGAAYVQLAARFRLDRLVVATGAALAVSILAARALLGTGTWVFRGLYVWVEVMGSVTVIQFWMFANEIYNAREARRLFALIGAGGILANVVVGFSVSGLASRIGAEDLLFLCAGLLAAGAALLHLVVRAAPGAAARPRAPARPAPAGPAPGLFRSAHLRIVAAVLFFTFLATTFIDFQFKVAAAAHFGQERDAMAAFFGRFFGIAGVAALAVQLAVTGRVLERVGVVGSLLVLPAFLGAGSALVLALPALWTATAAKSADLAFRYTVNDSTTQLLYLPLPTGQRRQAKAFLDGVLKPGTIAIAGLLLAAWRTRSSPLAPAAGAALACIALWVASLLRLRAEYVRSLRQNLKRRLLDVRGGEALSGDAAAVLRRALASPEPRDVESALELAHQSQADLSSEVGPLLSHPSARVRLLACDYLARAGDLRFAADVLLRFQDADPDVRAAAISAFCALARDRAARKVRPFLAAAEPQVRAAAVAGMIRHGGLDGILAAGEPLKQLLGSADPSQREQAARVLGAIGVPGFYQPVLVLLSDADARVRRAAVQAAAAMRSPELLPALVYRLARGETAQAAAEALAAHGPGIERLIAKVLANPREEPDIRRNAPRVLGRLATPEAVAILLVYLDDPDPALRRNVDLALARLARTHPELPVDLDRIRRACLIEMERAYRVLAAAEALGLDEAPFRRQGAPLPPRSDGRQAPALLAAALGERVDRAAERVSLLLGIVHPGAELDLVQMNLRDPSPARRANALEILDAVLDKRTKRRLVPLLDDRPREAKLREGAAFFSIPRLDGRAWLEALLGDESPWIATTALGFAVEVGLPVPRAGLGALLEHDAPFVREAALLAAQRLWPEAEREAAAARLCDDPFPPLRARARALSPRRPRKASA